MEVYRILEFKKTHLQWKYQNPLKFQRAKVSVMKWPLWFMKWKKLEVEKLVKSNQIAKFQVF